MNYPNSSNGIIKDLPKSINDVKDKGSWDNRKYNINDLRALRIGIVGLGNIGKKVSSIVMLLELIFLPMILILKKMIFQNL